MTAHPTFALLGSGEFLPWTEPMDRRLLERSRDPDGMVLVFPAASAHEGDHVFERWGAQGVAHYERLGARAQVMDVRRRDDASREDLIRRIDDAALIAFSGGNPARLAGIFAGTPMWSALLAAVADGVPYLGCSAGVSGLCERAFDNEVRFRGERWRPGLGLFREVLFAPHWDAIDRWVPGATRWILRSVPEGSLFVGLDERTALVGDGRTWSVHGEGRVHVRRGDTWGRFDAGAEVVLPLAMDLR